MNKKEFDMEKKLIKLKREAVDYKHELHIEELEFIRKTELLKHEWEKERGRIKTAEIRKSMERKERLLSLQHSGGNHATNVRSI